MQVGVFIPINNNGWLLSETAPQYMPSFELNRDITLAAERHRLDFVLSMIKLHGFGGKTQFWDHGLESFTLMAGLAAVTTRIKLFASVATLTIPPAIAARMCVTIDSISGGRFGLNLVTGWQKAEYDQMGLWPGDSSPIPSFSLVGIGPESADFVEVSAQQGWSIEVGKAGERGGRLGEVRSFLGELYGPDLHAKRIDALAGATLGVMAAASLAVAMIGQALAQARGLVTKHAVKQVDRLLSNNGIDVWDSFARWVPHQVGSRGDVLVAMDWTDFDHDGQSTLVLSLVTGHGRAGPLLWLSVWKEEIATRRNDYEDACLRRLAELVPPGCRVTILADRGFGDQKLFAFLGELGFGYVIRFRGNIRVAAEDGETKPAAEWVGKGGRACKLRHARVTAQGRQVGAVVCVQAKGMKQPWCLAASDPEATAAVLVKHYARRWTIEPAFRDTKDLRFGMGLSATRIGEPMRRDRLLLVSAFATALLTLLGAVGESLGMDRLLKSNTSTTRTHSLFRQGCMLYDLIPNMPEHRLAPLMQNFAEAVSKAGVFMPKIDVAK